MTAGDLVREMGGTGVLGAGRIGAAADIVHEMFSDPEYTNLLTLAGPIVPSGFRLVIGDLISRGFLDAIVSNGANMTHDVIEALGFRHYQGSFNVDDRRILRQGYNRIADIFVRESSFIQLDIRIRKMLKTIPISERKNIAFSELLRKIGLMLTDKESILYKSLWSFAQTETLQLNPMADATNMAEMAMTSKKLGVLIIGGGLPKHNALLASVLREGVDAAVQITADRPEPGGLSGAPLSESISWRKIREGGRFVDVYGDATVCLPLILAAVLEKVKKRKRTLHS